MNRQEIEFLRSLDPEQVDGTIQSVLMMENLTATPFKTVSEFLLKQLVKEKQYLIQNNIYLSNLLDN